MFLGDIDVGPASPRVYLYLILIAWMGLRVTIGHDRLQLSRAGRLLLVLYSMFVLWCVTATFLQGASVMAYLNRLLRYDLVAFVGCFLLLFIIRSRSDLRLFVSGLTGLVALSCVVAILQAIGNTAAWDLFVRLRPQFEDVERVTGVPIGFAPPGLYAASFTFGYFLAISTVLSVALFLQRNSLIRGVMLTLPAAGLLVAQQRSAVLAAALACGALLVNVTKRGTRGKLAIAMAITTAAFVGVTFLSQPATDANANANAFGKYANPFEDPTRLRVAQAAIGFILAHPLIGGLGMYQEALASGAAVTRDFISFSPHNMFLNAAVYYGLPALFFLAIFVFALMDWMLRVWRSALAQRDLLACGTVLSLAAYLVNAQFHNASFVSGDSLPWWLIGSLILAMRYPQEIRALPMKRVAAHRAQSRRSAPGPSQAAAVQPTTATVD